MRVRPSNRSYGSSGREERTTGSFVPAISALACPGRARSERGLRAGIAEAVARTERGPRDRPTSSVVWAGSAHTERETGRSSVVRFAIAQAARIPNRSGPASGFACRRQGRSSADPSAIVSVPSCGKARKPLRPPDGQLSAGHWLRGLSGRRSLAGTRARRACIGARAAAGVIAAAGPGRRGAARTVARR